MPATKLAAFNEKIAALSMRERVLGALAVLALGYLLVDQTLLAPAAERKQQVETERTALEANLGALRTRLAQVDGAIPTAESLAEKRREIAELEAKLTMARSLQRDFAERPLAVSALMRQALRTPNPRIVVESVKILPVIPVLASVSPPVFRHGVEIQVRGGYGDLLNYLSLLERDPRIFWSGLKLTAGTYPELTLSVSLYTLSSSEKPVLS
jgi:MSHA biogenesis protein MshJ